MEPVKHVELGSRGFLANGVCQACCISYIFKIHMTIIVLLSKRLLLLWIWLILDTKLLTGYSRKLCPNRTLHWDIITFKNFSHVSNFLTQTTSVTEENHSTWKDFIRQFVTLLGRLVPNEWFSHTVCHHFRKYNLIKSTLHVTECQFWKKELTVRSLAMQIDVSC